MNAPVDPATLCLSDLVHSGAVVGEPRTGDRRFWTGREEKVLRQHFPAGGLAPCLPLLPGRSAGSIYQRANMLGLVSPAARRAPRGPRWSTSEGLDAVIRREYPGCTDRGAVMALAARLGRPRWWVSRRAAALGLVSPTRKEPPWSEPELELLGEHAHRKPEAIRARLKRLGFERTATAILVKLKRQDLDRTDPDRMTARQLAGAMGVDGKTVTRWIEKGWLKAARRGTARVAAQGGDEWWISRRAVARFVVNTVAAIDLRKVDKVWFVDLLVEHGGKARRGGDA